MNRMLRNQLKDFYKTNKKEDRKIGYRINELVQILVKSPIKNIRKENDKLKFDTTPEANLAYGELEQIRGQPRFRADFPDFPSFKKFVKENKLSLKELKDVDSEII